jgi:hypothetical protein
MAQNAVSQAIRDKLRTAVAPATPQQQQLVDADIARLLQAKEQPLSLATIEAVNAYALRVYLHLTNA